MKVLVYGMGALGSFCAASLARAGQDVTVLARGQRLADLREHGIVLQHPITGVRSITPVAVIDTLPADAAYDWIIVVVGKHDLREILPVLAANRVSPNLLFMGNNVTGWRELAAYVGRERVVMGFLMAVGRLDGPVAVAANTLDGHTLKSLLGEPDGTISPRLLHLAEVFNSAGLPVAFSDNIDAYLKCHAALILPMCGAYYLTGSDLERLADTRDALLLFVRGVREALTVLRAYDIPIIPPALKIFLWLPEPLLLAFIRRRIRNPLFKYGLMHAGGIRPEARQLAREFSILARTAPLPTPALDRTIAATAEGARVMPPGSRRLGLDWGRIYLGAAALTALAGLAVSIGLLRRRHESR
jgi:2-dehydropantoate 2-reductase